MKHQPPANLSQEDLARGYYESSWKGHVRWCCVHCPFDTFQPGMIDIHVFETHLRTELLEQAARTGALQRPIRAHILDPKGQKIEHVPVVYREGEPLDLGDDPQQDRSR